MQDLYAAAASLTETVLVLLDVDLVVLHLVHRSSRWSPVQMLDEVLDERSEQWQ